MVFLDKDGTLVEDVPYNVDPERVRLAPRAADAVRLLAERGWRVVVVTNQSGVARGMFAVAALEGVRTRIAALLRDECNAGLAGFYYCPHHPDGSVAEFAVPCGCRKPGTGLLEQAASDLAVSLRDSWMVGDILDDVEAGNRAGCRTILVDNGHETEWREGALRHPGAIVPDLLAAARIVVEADGARTSRPLALARGGCTR